MSDWTLRRIVDEGMKPTGRYAKSTIMHRRSSAKLYAEYRGSEQAACEVTFRLLEKFRDWQLQRGKCEDRAREGCEHVAAIVRFADEDLLPRRTRRPAFFDAAVECSLEKLVTGEYVASKMNIAADSTLNQYAWAIARFSKFLGRPALLDDLTDETVGRWLRSMRDEGLAVPTINGYLAKVKAFWNWCAKKRYVDKFPTLQDMPTPRRIPRAWTIAQMRQLLAACDKMKGAVAGARASLWWRAFVTVCFDTGERSGALLALRWEHFDADRGQLESPAEIRKGGKKAMLYRLRPEAVEALEAIRLPEREVIFAWDRSLATFYTGYRRLLKHAKLPWESHRSGPQKVRRTFATFVEAGGGDATQALDHTSRRVTVNSYLDARLIERPSPNRLLPSLESA
jgi:integrase